MDSSMARPQIQIDAIKNALQNGTMSIRRIRDILLREIEQELDKPSEEVNMAYVNACQDFLTRLESSRANAINSHFNENLEAIRLRTRKPFNASLVFSVLRPVTAVCVAILVLFGGLLFPNARIITRQSPDEEQFIITGEQTMPGELNVADADYRQTFVGTYVTDDWEDAVAVYGSTPSRITKVPDGWSVDSYQLIMMENYSSFVTVYASDIVDHSIVFEVTKYYDLANVHTNVEQDNAGTIEYLPNGNPMYITTNMGYSVIVWQDINTTYTLGGPLAMNDLLNCAKSVYSSE